MTLLAGTESSRLKTEDPKRQASNCIKSFQLFCQTDHQTIHKSRKPSGPERPLGARPEIKTPQNWAKDQGELSARAKQNETKMTSTRSVDWTTLRATQLSRLSSRSLKYFHHLFLDISF